MLSFVPNAARPDFLHSGERSMKCDNCEFHIYFNTSAAVAALVTDEKGRLMLVRRGVEPNYGKLDLPGGFVDPGETAEQAVERELFEELGLKVKSIRYIGSATNEYIFSGFSVFTLDLAFRAEAKTLVGLKPMDDILEYHFYSETEIDYDEIPAPSIKKFVIDYFRNE